MAAIDQAGDIQALVERGFGSLKAASYLLLRIDDATVARGWLRSLRVTSLADAKAAKLSQVCQIAFTAAGLRALGIHPDPAMGFSPDFTQGMASDPRRSHRLGDTGSNAPDQWDWGYGAQEPHVLLIVLTHPDARDQTEADLVKQLAAQGCTLIAANRSSFDIGREPFGFADGLTQPKLDWDGTLKPGGAKDRIYRNSIAAGEILLGHANEYGFVAAYPAENGLGRNGTYLVYRQLEQDVAGFWEWLNQEAGSDGALALAEAMVGRQIDGQPLGQSATDSNDFDFSGDPDGVTCPIGAHIRRANPRSGDDPQGRQGFFRDVISSLGLKGSAMHDAVASARFHRVLRRGRAYGPVHTPAAVPEKRTKKRAKVETSGLHFICLNASIARQFEFVQGAWIASPYFAGLSGEQDPLLGNREPANGGGATDAFSNTDGNGCPRLATGLPQFVTVKGGAYFFMPGLKGLAQILAG